MQTVADLDNAFRLYVDKADSQGSADFLEGERQQFLNDAQLRLARELVSNKSDDQDAVDLRRSLSKLATLPIAAGGEFSALDLPDDYLAWGRARAQLATPYENYHVATRLISENELSSLLGDPFNRPRIAEPVVCFLHGALQYYPGGAAQRLELSYYHRPAALDLSTPAQVPDLAPALLPALVQYAVQLALESVADPRFATQARVAALTAG